MHMTFRNVTALLIACFGIVLTAGCSDNATFEQPVARAAYIYDTDADTASGYQAFFAANSWQVDLVQRDDLVATNLSGYDLLIIGADTDVDEGDWGTPAQIAAIEASNTPILGIGYGGAMLFELIDAGELEITAGNSMGYGNHSVVVDDAAYFDGISGVTVGSTVQLLSPGASARGIYGGVVSNASPIAHDTVYTGHYTIIREGSYALWGFNNGADTLTVAGQQVFMNLARSLAFDV